MLLLLYGSIVIVIGSFFLVRDIRLMFELHHNLPLLFLLRFSVFWFMCLMIAVAGYFMYLSHNQLLLPEPDKVYAARLGRMAFYVGVTGGSLAFIGFVTLHRFPFI